MKTKSRGQEEEKKLPAKNKGKYLTGSVEVWYYINIKMIPVFNVVEGGVA